MRDKTKENFRELLNHLANAHASMYIERHQRVAFDSFVAGLATMAEILGGDNSLVKAEEFVRHKNELS